MGQIYQMQMKIPFDMSDVNGNIKIPQLILLSLQVSEMQSESLGISDQDLLEKHQLVWIVTDYEMILHRLPAFGDEIRIETEALSYNRLFCYRRFTIFDRDGEVLVEMLASFVMMNRETRKVQPVDGDLLAPYQSSFDKKVIRGPKYPATEMLEQKEFQIRFYDLDMNGHVNNSKYLDWIFEALGVAFLTSHVPRKINLKYVKEVRSDGTIASCVEREGLVSSHQIRSDAGIHAQAIIEWRKEENHV
ncbi:acyl-ACP thioesterase domain-containing protein [Streptococcus himalayensis]|uniref:Acyl-ACP thioesterase n=1 Tax=Streptococcus himalayensis TaxID=1888195 RepID=A0A917AAI1_9STRE|nr:acyl-ACP thioesterase domain-containing protein [Streptococcus himalayensis]GGE38197.1 acyl-ACP thioesterase [Streptococcus himalayensis]